MADFAARRTTMVDTQIRPSDVTNLPTIDAFLSVPREDFVPDHLREAAYLGEHLPLPDGRVVTDPRVLAKMVDALDIGPEDAVLVVNATLGYATAIAAHLGGFAVGVEPDEAMADEAQATLSAAGIDAAAIVAGALTEGYAKSAPYAAILIDGGVEVVPDALLAQLDEGGRIVALFREGALGVVRLGFRKNGRVTWRDLFNATAPVLPGFERPLAFSL